MAEEVFYLSKADRRVLQQVIRAHRGGKTSHRPPPTRRPPRGGGGGGMNVVHGSAVGAVAAGATFDIDQIELVNGVMPSGVDEASADTIEVVNPFGFELDDNGLARAEQADDGTWYAVQAECPA